MKNKNLNLRGKLGNCIYNLQVKLYLPGKLLTKTENLEYLYKSKTYFMYIHTIYMFYIYTHACNIYTHIHIYMYIYLTADEEQYTLLQGALQ